MVRVKNHRLLEGPCDKHQPVGQDQGAQCHQHRLVEGPHHQRQEEPDPLVWLKGGVHQPHQGQSPNVYIFTERTLKLHLGLQIIYILEFRDASLFW